MDESYEAVRIKWLEATQQWAAAGWPNQGPVWWKYSQCLAQLRDAGAVEVASRKKGRGRS